MEALEELQELNKREVKVNYDEMLSTYDKIREVVNFIKDSKLEKT